MNSFHQVPFKEILRRLIGVYVIIRFINPHDEIGGVVKSVEDGGKVTLEMGQEIYTHIAFIEKVIIPNLDEEKADETPLTKALKKAQE